MASGPLTLARIEQLARAGRITAARAAAEDLAASDDAGVLVTLAMWAMTGQPLGRDLGRARRLFLRAADLGHGEAASIAIALLAQGTGGPRDWPEAMRRLAKRDNAAARRQQALLAAMSLDAEGGPNDVPGGRPLCTAPRILLVPGLFSRDECAYLIETARPLLQPSVVIDPRSGAFVHDPIRTSYAAAFPLMEEDPVIHALNRRIAAACGTSVGQGEPLQILRYRPGQEYRLHQDAIAGAPNQRILTGLVYLNDDYNGGETLFPAADLAVRGGTGDALFFSNVGQNGLPDKAAIHAGRAVLTGTKMLASRWIRERPLI